MRSCGVFFVLFLVVAAVLLSKTDVVYCKATIEKIEEEAAGVDKQAKGRGAVSESWAEWTKGKLSFKSADDQDSNQDKICVEDKACESAEEPKKKAEEAYEKTGEAKDKGRGESVRCEEESGGGKQEESTAEAEKKAKEGYEAAKSKAEETYESGKEKLSNHREL